MTDKNDKENSTYIYLDFGDRISQETFQQPVFFRIANLQKTNPLVQLNEFVYKGCYDLSLGTNLFFEVGETQQLQQEDAFETKPNVSLEHIFNQTKVIHLHPVKVRPKRAELPHRFKDIKYNFDWDYNTLLDKFANGTLKLEDIGIENKISEKETEIEVVEEIGTVVTEEVSEGEKMEKFPQPDLSSKLLGNSYERLQNLARRPTKRQISDEIVEECDPLYRKAFEYHNYEKQILKPSVGFPVEDVTEVDENTLSDCVDVNRCVLFGLIQPSSDFPRILTSEEKKTILTVDNFDNLALTARYYVMCCHIEDLKRTISVFSDTELLEKNESAKNAHETLEIYNKLRNALGKRISEIRASLNVSKNADI